MGILSICGKAFSFGTTPINFDIQDPQIYVTPATISNIPYEGGTYNISVCGAQWNQTCVVDACTWITCAAALVTPTATPGTTTTITVACNPSGGAARSGVVCYTPQSGCATRQVTVSQLCSPVTNISVSVDLYWDASFGSTNGFGGRYCLRCSDGTGVCQRILLNYTKYDTQIFSVPVGTYYVDFTSLEAQINGQSVTWSFCWDGSMGNGSNCCTSCFTTNSYVYGYLPNGYPI